VKLRREGETWKVASESDEKLWKVIAQTDSLKGHILKEGDVIKLGRMQYIIKELRNWVDLQESPANCTPDTSGEFAQDEVAEEFEEVQQNCCRICFGDVSSPDDPLISPCSCSGTMQLIHYKCLKHWINLRMDPQ